MIAGVMPDMLARLYDLPDATPYEKLVGAFVIPGSDPGIYAPLYEIRSQEGA